MVRTNRRRARVICAVPGVVAGVVVGAVLALIGLPVVGVVALVVVALAVAVGIWRAAPGVIVRSLGAVPSREQDHPRLHNLVDGLCATMGLPGPQILVVASGVPNALAVGHDPESAIIVVTSALDRSLTLVELEGVLAHELVHVKRNDTVVASVAVLATLPWALVRGTAAGADRIHSLVGPGREFSADQRAAGVVRYPPGIGSALETMVAAGAEPSSPWPPGKGRIAALTRWLWIDPIAGGAASSGAGPGHQGIVDGNLDDTRVRAAAQALL